MLTSLVRWLRGTPDAAARAQPAAPPAPPLFAPNGHFYSPVVDIAEARRDEHLIWPERPVVHGIDFNEASHRRILDEAFPRFIADYGYPDTLPEGAPEDRFYNINHQFGWLDSRALFVLMRDLAPARVIEVGSGYSSLLMADVNLRFLGGATQITCIEPYPRPFLRAGVPGIARVIESRVQDVPVDEFRRLAAGDFLFIDSSHVSKTGSDVNYLFFRVLPVLAPGVIVHIHDIILPHDYPKGWVLTEGRSWNEQYVVQALLMYSRAFRVLFSCSHAYHAMGERVAQAMRAPQSPEHFGASLWLEVLPHE